jgi:hypothetical protein
MAALSIRDLDETVKRRLARQVTAGRWRLKYGRFLRMPSENPLILPGCSRLY